MKKFIPTALAGLITITAVSYSISADRQRLKAEQEADTLREQIATLPAVEKTADPFSSPPQAPETASSNENYVAELEAEVTTLRSQVAELEEKIPPPRESWEERMARMKAEDPEGYAEMIEHRAERREEMRYNLAERTASFMELDSTEMNDLERENHELLIQKMGEFWDLTEQLQDPEQRPSRETREQFRELAGEVRPLMEAERQTMFRQLADELALSGEDAQAFSSYIEDIIEVTTIQMPGRGGRGGPR